MDDPPGITRDQYCSPNVTLETAWAILIEVEPLEDLRCAFMVWRGDKQAPRIKSDKGRVRDLRPGDTVEVEGWLRKVARVEIYR